jgi:hypothetical protein
LNIRILHHEDTSERFDRALQQQTRHLDEVSRWYEALLLADAKLLSREARRVGHMTRPPLIEAPQGG